MSILLFVAGLMSYSDRALPLLLTDPIKMSFQVSDTKIALLTGFSFSISLAVFALPLSWLADQGNRARLLTAGIACWSATTVASGFATSFWMLFVLRMGVGLGEAALIPTAYSLLADLFPTRLLPRPLGLLALSQLLGNVLAMNVGGVLYEFFRAYPLSGLFGSPALEAWRSTMVAFGAAGLLVAVVSIWVLKEPRTGKQIRVNDGASGTSFGHYIRASAFFFVPYTIANCAYVLQAQGSSSWMAPYFVRTFGWSIGDTGQALGLSSLVTGLAGVPLGIWISQFMRTRMGREAPVAAIWVMLVSTLPAVLIAPFSPNGWLAIVGFSIILLPASAATVVAPVVMADSAPPHLRARMTAMFGLVYGIVGGGFGALSYGAFTDYVLHDAASLRVTLSLLSGTFLLTCIPLLVLSDKRYSRITMLARTAENSRV